MPAEDLPSLLARLRELRGRATTGEWLNGGRIMPEDGCVALQCEEHADIYIETEHGNANVACATFSAEPHTECSAPTRRSIRP